MKRILILSLFIVICGLFILPDSAYAQLKNSTYFMMDDGEFSEEEKDLEAEYVYTQCSRNSVKQFYFDCGCVAGMLRNARDAELITPQSQILQGIYNSEAEVCVDIPKIAGRNFGQCMDLAPMTHPYSTPTEHGEFCSCVGNMVAKEFSKNPKLDTDYIKNLQSSSMTLCTPIETPS